MNNNGVNFSKTSQKPHKNLISSSSPQTFEKQNEKIKKKIKFVQYFGGKMRFFKKTS